MNLVKEYSQIIYDYKPNKRLFPTTESLFYRATLLVQLKILRKEKTSENPLNKAFSEV